MTVKIDRNSGKAPRELVLLLVAGQAYPFLAQLQHKNTKPLVVPSSGINTPIAPGEPVKVKVKSLDQAWMLVTDLAELAHRADNSADDFATLTANAVVPVPTETTDVAPVLETTPVETPAGKPGKAKAPQEGV